MAWRVCSQTGRFSLKKSGHASCRLFASPPSRAPPAGLDRAAAAASAARNTAGIHPTSTHIARANPSCDRQRAKGTTNPRPQPLSAGGGVAHRLPCLAPRLTPSSPGRPRLPVSGSCAPQGHALLARSFSFSLRSAAAGCFAGSLVSCAAAGLAGSSCRPALRRRSLTARDPRAREAAAAARFVQNLPTSPPPCSGRHMHKVSRSDSKRQFSNQQKSTE